MANHVKILNQDSGADMSGYVQKTDPTTSGMAFILSASGTTGAISVEAPGPVTMNYTVTGAKVGDAVMMNFQNDSTNGLIVGQPYVSAADTVSIDFGCGDETDGESNMSSANYEITVIRKVV